MKWYLKALVQNGVALLPDKLAQPLYYQLQLRLGELRAPRFDMRYGAAVQMAKVFSEHHHGLAGRRVLEVGTGRFVDVPIALWLMGVENTLTVDLNPLLRADQVHRSITYLRQHWAHYRERFATYCDPREL
ncbi:MAG TPA: hypothetical protein ENK23_04220, partial [Sorangium sp.]|nr:hypothetical protein [Sorangium sp.]